MGRTSHSACRLSYTVQLLKLGAQRAAGSVTQQFHGCSDVRRQRAVASGMLGGLHLVPACERRLRSDRRAFCPRGPFDRLLPDTHGRLRRLFFVSASRRRRWVTAARLLRRPLRRHRVAGRPLCFECCAKVAQPFKFSRHIDVISAAASALRRRFGERTAAREGPCANGVRTDGGVS